MKDVLSRYYPFWNQLDQQQIQEFEGHTSIHFYSKGEQIYSSHEECLGVFQVMEGEVRVYIQSEDGREVTLFRLKPGEVCTLSASCIMDEITFDIMMEATQDTKLLVTTVSFFKRLMDENIYVENYIYKQTAERFSDVMWALTEILFRSFDRRLSGYLLEEIHNHKLDKIKKTHEEIAKDLGSAREVVSRMLKYFEKEGYVKLSRGTVTVTDAKGLGRLQ